MNFNFSKNEFYRLKELNFTNREIADMWYISISTLELWLRESKLTRTYIKAVKHKKINEKQVRDMLDNGLTKQEISIIIGYSIVGINKALRRLK